MTTQKNPDYIQVNWCGYFHWAEPPYGGPTLGSCLILKPHHSTHSPPKTQKSSKNMRVTIVLSAAWRKMWPDEVFSETVKNKILSLKFNTFSITIQDQYCETRSDTTHKKICKTFPISYYLTDIFSSFFLFCPVCYSPISLCPVTNNKMSVAFRLFFQRWREQISIVLCDYNMELLLGGLVKAPVMGGGDLP